MKKLVVVTLLVFLFSCKKEENIHIVALNPVTGEHYAGLTFYLVQQKTTSNDEENTTLKTGTLNSNGEAIFSIKLNRKHAYMIKVEEPDNTCYNKSIQMYLDSPYDDGKFTFEFAPCGNIKLNINNVNCLGATDTFKLFHIGSSAGYESYFGTNPVKEGSGCYSYLQSQFSDVPMGYRYYRWEVTRNGITDIIYDTIYINSGEDFIYNVNY
ncbi:MAG: hypothetical protein ACK476_15010 [Fluviicola sp.]